MTLQAFGQVAVYLFGEVQYRAADGDGERRSHVRRFARLLAVDAHEVEALEEFRA